MVYFGGTPDRIGGHDVTAKKIAERAREFAVERWRWEDMQSYMLLTILEVSWLPRLSLWLRS
jgi:hypothetical protein